MQAVGSVMTNKYSEGYPGARYYGGNEWVENFKRICHLFVLWLRHNASKKIPKLSTFISIRP